METDSQAGKQIRLLVATPAYGGMVHADYMRGVLKLQRLCQEQGIAMALWLGKGESLVQRARNCYVHDFLKGNYTHLLSVDADISFEPQVVMAMLATGHEMVCCAYPKKGLDWEAIERAARRWESDPWRFAARYAVNPMPEIADESGTGEDGRPYFTFNAENFCIPIRDAATGFLLTTREAILEMCYAMPETLHISDTEQTKGEAMFALFDCEIERGTMRYLSEDYLFSRRWQRMGKKVWMYIGPFCDLGHIGSYEFRGDPYAQFEPVGIERGELASESGLPEDQRPLHTGLMLERYQWAAHHLKGAKLIADAACGPGYGVQVLSRATGARVVGWDRDAANIKIARDRGFGEAEQVDDIAIESFDGYDAICTLETIEHLPDPVAWLRGLSPTVTRLALSCPCIPTKHRNVHHLHDFTYDEVLRILQALGWTVRDHMCQCKDTILVYAERGELVTVAEAAE